ncbi:hypothetical protein HNQ91_002260 [Filimonas zeae]|uniref:hypothetical protein n=1 Tax=Filimonas zeae TaxID=1737353 RepID=UPI0016691F6D|nr:hypothetical protein [Filimonas zeae]MDR6339209.1 hypothetical protein [Filimonas zeae]
MKYIILLSFLLVPVLSNCQTNGPKITPRSVADTTVFPPVSRAWSFFEFRRVLEKIILSQHYPNIMINMYDNRELLEKVTDIKNYWFFSDTGYTYQERGDMLKELLKLALKCNDNYYQDGRVFEGRYDKDKEMVAFSILYMAFAKTLMELAEAERKAYPKLVPKNSLGIDMMHDGLAKMADGELLILEKYSSFYYELSLCKLAAATGSFLSFVITRMPPKQRIEFKGRMTQLAMTHKAECVRTAMQQKR